MDIKKLEEKLKEIGEPKFRLEQIKKAVFQDGVSSFSEITTISKSLREELQRTFDVPNGHQMSTGGILSFEVEKILEAKDKQSIKALFKLYDGNLIESVLISPKPGDWSACISSQVGCPLSCGFCETGRMGLKRNLTAEEITDQVLFWKNYLRTARSGPTAAPQDKNCGRTATQKVTDIVYMGMGEPFLNWDNVKESLKNLTDPKLFGFGSRSISVSTSGIPEGIEKLAEEFPQINLALSLHFADDQKRSEIMPINRKNNLEALRKSLQNYFSKTKRKIFLEYIMLEKINDSKEDAEKLVRFVKSIGKLQLLHVNLIRYNYPEKGSDPSIGIGSLRPSSRERIVEFKNFLLQNHIPVTIRKSLGEEIQGACGQLAGK
ncbi:MAG TPA: 23S rRNA (adenine(2503)-C(2))-methyltransferase RlmN [Candidatus Moranbacteria bacterium]|nr:23S rRNA (adenine(2503)-C(2))-methyltransferase RlmN [Candidatus Moranbacteria bacterium]